MKQMILLLLAILVAAPSSLWPGSAAAGKAEVMSGDVAPPPVIEPLPFDQTELREKWGIEVTSLYFTAGGYMVDFRYRVLDKDKAAMLGSEVEHVYLLDQATGFRHKVPNYAKTGPLRQTSDQMEEGRIYFVMFANPGRRLKPGSKVTVVVGDFKVPDLVVK